jgi:hypothetical protein
MTRCIFTAQWFDDYAMSANCSASSSAVMGRELSALGIPVVGAPTRALVPDPLLTSSEIGPPRWAQAACKAPPDEVSPE